MKAPEKIYLNPIQDALTELLSTKVKGDIEYTRTDAFIKKACNWIKYYNENGGCLFDGWEDDFKKYMEE
jgi:hypothetical protein